MNRPGNSRLSQRIAEEKQLLAEEKWIIEMLAGLNRQKNSLQIERLHLEHQKAQILKGKKSIADGDEPNLLPTPLSKSVEEPQPSDPDNILEMFQTGASTRPILEDILPAASLDDGLCNSEELNLSITNSVFANQDHGAFDMEEEEEDPDNCEIDMNMFMYGG